MHNTRTQTRNQNFLVKPDPKSKSPTRHGLRTEYSTISHWPQFCCSQWNHITIARCTPLIADCSVLNEMGTWAAVGSYESIAPLGQVLLPPRAPGSIPPTNQRPTYDQRRPSAGRSPPYITICLSYISIPLPTPPKTTHQTVTKYKVGNDLKDLLDGWRIPLTYRFFQDFLSGRACKAIFFNCLPQLIKANNFYWM